MINRLKFRVYGGAHTGKYVYNLEDGCEAYLTLAFQASMEEGADSWMFLQIDSGKTIIHFLKPGLQWNGENVDSGFIEIRPGSLIGHKDCIVEILECPHWVHEDEKERTSFLDLRELRKQNHSSNHNHVQPFVELEEERTKDVIIPEGAFQSPSQKIPPTIEPWWKSQVSQLSAAIFCATGVALLAYFFVYPLTTTHSHSPETLVADVHESPVDSFVASNLVPSKDDLQPAEKLPVTQERRPTSKNPSEMPASKPKEDPLNPDQRREATNQESAARENGDIQMKLINAIQANDVNSVKALFQDQGFDLNSFLNLKGQSPVHQAAALGRVSILKILVKENANLNQPDFQGNTPLMLAVQAQREKTVSFLIDHGAKIEMKRNDGADASLIASKLANKEIQKLVQAKWFHDETLGF